MAVTTFHDFPLAPRDRDARIWYDVGSDITRARNHLAKYYKKMGETASWERD